MAPRASIRHRYPWPARALGALEQLAAENRSFRKIARELKARGLVFEIIDAATVRRAVLSVRKAVQP